MSLLGTIVIIVGIVLLFYSLYKIYKLLQENVELEKEHLQKQDDLHIAPPETLIEDTIEELEPEPEVLYKLNTHKVRYLLYEPSCDGLYELGSLYDLVVRRNLWINEPFHTKFYEFLMLINDNNFMIVNPNSNVITMNTRDKNNKMQISKSYQVYSTKDIIKYAIQYCMPNIKRFTKQDAQNLVISIFILALKQSAHYLSGEVPKNTIDKILKGYEHAQDIKYIVELVEAKNKQCYFIQESIYNSFSVVKTFPYNDSEVIKPLEIRQSSPQKLLQTI